MSTICQNIERIENYSINPEFEICGDDINVQLVTFNHPTNGEITEALCQRHLKLLKRRLKKFERNLPNYESKFIVHSKN